MQEPTKPGPISDDELRGARAYLERALPLRAEIRRYDEIWEGFILDIRENDSAAPIEWFQEYPPEAREAVRDEIVLVKAIRDFTILRRAEESIPEDSPEVATARAYLEGAGYFARLEATLNDAMHEFRVQFMGPPGEEVTEKQLADRDEFEASVRESMIDLTRERFAKEDGRRDIAREILVHMRADLMGAQAEGVEAILRENPGATLDEIRVEPAWATEGAFFELFAEFAEGYFLEELRKQAFTLGRFLRWLENQTRLEAQTRDELARAITPLPTPPPRTPAPKPARTRGSTSHSLTLGGMPHIPSSIILPAATQAFLGDAWEQGPHGSWFSRYEGAKGWDGLVEQAMLEYRPDDAAPDITWEQIASALRDPRTLDTAMILIAHSLASGDPFALVSLYVNDLLEYKGEERNKGGFRRESADREEERLRALRALRTELANIVTYEPGGKRGRKQTKIVRETLSGPLFLFSLEGFRTEIDVELDEDGSERFVENRRGRLVMISYRLGEWARPLSGETGRMLAKTMHGVFTLDARATIAKRLGYYLSWQFRVRAHTATYAQPFTVGNLLRAAHVEIPKEQPGRFRERVERDWDTLRDMGLLGSWGYVLDEQGRIPRNSGKGWADEWLAAQVTILPGAEILEAYASIAKSKGAKAAHAQAVEAVTPRREIDPGKAPNSRGSKTRTLR